MSVGKQNIKVQNIEQAVVQLQSEVRYFDQLSRQFPDYERSLKKHSADCSVAAKKIQQNRQQNNRDLELSSLRTANAFLTEGRRLRLKLRINHLKQEATGLELEAGRWPGLKAEFKLLAEDCRKIASVCKESVDIAALPDIEELLIMASELYEKSIDLRQAQRIKLREEAIMLLTQRVHTLKKQADILQRDIVVIPTRAKKYKQLSVHCLQVAHQIEDKIEKASLFELTRAIKAADDFIARVIRSHKKHRFPDTTAPEVSEDVVAPEVSEDVVAAKVSEDVVAPEVSEDVVAPEVSEDVVAAEVSEDVVAAEVSEDVVAAEVSEDVAEIEASEQAFFPAALRTVINEDAKRNELERQILLEKRSRHFAQNLGSPSGHSEKHSFFGLISLVFSKVISGFIAAINYFINGLAITLKNIVQFIERIFMFLIIGVGIVTVVFVVVYLVGSGYDDIGFLDFITKVLQRY